jgi:Ca2+-binding EF-hand superfamily protein
MKMTVPLCIAALIVTPAGTLFAQASKAPAAAAKPGPQPIPRARFIADMEAEFRSMDSDKNNTLTTAEIEASQRKAIAENAAAKARALFVQLDADKNGQISQTEFAKIPLSSGKPDAKPMLSRLDSNKDNAITLVEFRGGTLVNFDRLDTDKDGTVSTAEMRSAGIGGR